MNEVQSTLKPPPFHLPPLWIHVCVSLKTIHGRPPGKRCTFLSLCAIHPREPKFATQTHPARVGWRASRRPFHPSLFTFGGGVCAEISSSKRRCGNKIELYVILKGWKGEDDLKVSSKGVNRDTWIFEEEGDLANNDGWLLIHGERRRL